MKYRRGVLRQIKVRYHASNLFRGSIPRVPIDEVVCMCEMLYKNEVGLRCDATKRKIVTCGLVPIERALDAFALAAI